MTAGLLRGDALRLPLADGTVDLCVTSPPYFGVRSYTDGGEHYDGQIGDEATPGEFVDALIAATAEMVRVLKPSGSIWVNLGDKYAGAPSGPRTPMSDGYVRDYEQAEFRTRTRRDLVGIPTKSLIGLPWRYAIRCIDELGLILRAEVIWSKCLSGGAYIYVRTPTGDRPVMLRDLVRAYRPEDCQVWNGYQWTQILAWERTPDRSSVIELELRSGERIGCTIDHRWPTARGIIRADEVRVGDIIRTTRIPEPSPARSPALLPDEDIGWLVGLYIAEGSRSATTVQIAGHIREDARHARLARIAAALDGTFTVYRVGENTAAANLHGAVIRGVLDRYVSRGTAKTKHLLLPAWQRSDAFLAAVVDGYLSGDGHYDAKNDRWRLGFTENDDWAANLRTLAARLGASLRLRRHAHQGFGQTFPGWRGEWRWTQRPHHNAKDNGEVVAIRVSRARDFYDVEVADEPHLFALASGVLTHNSNGLPESVTDRVRRSHEQWFHMVKSPRYFSAVDEIREAYEGKPQRRLTPAPQVGAYHGQDKQTMRGREWDVPLAGMNPLGKLPGSVWTIASQPLNVPPELGIDHYAAFPCEFPRRIIRGWSPSGICTVCGEGRRPAVERGESSWQRRRADGDPVRYGLMGNAAPLKRSLSDPTDRAAGGFGVPADRRIVGESCACPEPTAPTRPSIILDPFGGTGTASLVADVLGRRGVSLDMSADYCRLARWRTTDLGERARAMQVEKPPPAPKDTDSLLDLLDPLDITDGGAA